MHAESPRSLGRDPRGSRIAIHAELAVGERHLACVCSLVCLLVSALAENYLTFADRGDRKIAVRESKG